MNENEINSSNQQFLQTAKPIGPIQLQKIVEGCLSQIDVEHASWKNIPQPVCLATQQLVECADAIKRFVLFMEQRFTNLTLSSRQLGIEFTNSQYALRLETENNYEKFKTGMQSQMDELITNSVNKIEESSANTKIAYTQLLNQSITKETTFTKKWTKKEIVDHINRLDHKLIEQFNERSA